MYGLPSLQMIMTIAIVPVLIAFAIVNYKENVYSVLTWVVVCVTDLLVMTGYFPFMYKAWSEDNPKPNKSVELIDPYPTRASDNIPQVMDGGRAVYSQGTETVSINAIKGFNQHLMTQHMGGLPINMTENYWVKKNNGAEQSEWVRIGGTGPTDWRNMMERGVRWGAYGEEGGQGKRVPLNWRKISQLSQGYPLPQLPTSPTSKR